MKICVFGAGAIGGTIGAGLCQAGIDVTLIGRGAHFAAIREHGLTIVRDGTPQTCRPAATDDPREAGRQDFVIVTVKAHAAPGIVDAVQPLLGPGTAVLTAMNGIPWWYFHRAGGPHDGRGLESVDPGGVQWSGIGPERAIGAVVYTAAEVVEPGVVAFVFGDAIHIGEPDGSSSVRCQRLSEALTAAGFAAPVRPRIRDDIWLKLWGNLSFNPVSALTHGTLEDIAHDPGTRILVRAMMIEAQAVGETLGIYFAMDVDERIDMAAGVGAHRSSMLQDLVRGRSMEIDPLVTVVQEMADLVGVATPTIDMVASLVNQRAQAAADER